MSEKNPCWNSLELYKSKLPKVGQEVLLWHPEHGYLVGKPRDKDAGGTFWRFGSQWKWHPLPKAPK